jgi:hypothetical protein
MKDEIVLYQPNEELSLEVKVENDTVWLNRNQMAVLFDRDVKTIGKHINNALREELAPTVAKNATLQNDNPTVAKFAIVQQEGNRSVVRQVEYYSLDVILSVGYRVKSSRGIEFRRWANRVLNELILRGYTINQRLLAVEDHVDKSLMAQERRLEAVEQKIDFFVRTSLPPVEGIFYDGQIFDAYTFVNDLIRSAKKRIVLIDNYIDDRVLTMLDKRNDGVKATIYTKNFTKQLSLDIEQHNKQFAPIDVEPFNLSHDRFMIIDDIVYHIGASLKDLGKAWFAFTKMNDISAEELLGRIK